MALILVLWCLCRTTSGHGCVGLGEPWGGVVVAMWHGASGVVGSGSMGVVIVWGCGKGDVGERKLPIQPLVGS